MLENKSNYNAKTLLEKLNSQGFSIDSQVPDFIIEYCQNKEFTTYSKIFVSIGSFIVSLFFIILTILVIRPGNNPGFIFLGIWTIIIALLMQRSESYEDEIKNLATRQSSLALMIAGKVFFVFGFSGMIDSAWVITLGVIIITLITYPIYEVSIDRFLSSLAVLVYITNTIFVNHPISVELLFNLFFLTQFISIFIMLAYKNLNPNLYPLLYALILFLYKIMFAQILPDYFGIITIEPFIDTFFINIALTLGLIASIIWLAGDINNLKQEKFIISILGAILLGLISAPSILLTITLMIFAYAGHDRLLGILSIISFHIFISIYYYDLNFSLLYKSAVLVGSGIVLILGKLYVSYRCWDKEESNA
jgi:hypothetical protein